MTEAPALTPRQARAVEAILASATREEAAKQVGVSDRTLRRWSNLEPFAAELRRQRTRLLDGAASALASGTASCARTLVEIAVAGGSPRDAVRVSAARAVLDLASRFEESTTIAARLSELETAVAATQAPNNRRGTPWQ